jgi:hypothetical protein
LEYTLNPERVDVNQAHLEQVKCDPRDFLAVGAIGGDFTTPPLENEAVGAIPVLDFKQSPHSD